MFVKICGTTTVADATLSLQLGADALGLIFSPSKRQVSIPTAATIARGLPTAAMLVGVFTMPDPDYIASAVREVGLAAIQMHWPYAPESVTALRAKLGQGVQLWQVVGIDTEAAHEAESLRTVGHVLQAAYAERRIDVVLLDAVRGSASGGLGQTFSWRRAAPLVDAAERSTRLDALGGHRRLPKLIVAGGLRAENVGEALADLHPWGVDVVSGVEAEPGKKDLARLHAFIASARGSSDTYRSSL